ncbi:Fanconi-associated nuclease 1-like protein [Auxenochlorella protothecoides]|uniref:Fanconi-associated nuclease n=1 Tax=Auxenochlorella protothecoides TaxID=3075 RepID=A0A087SS49_AUXPR|nr:Fanconi-associated nuclease 1-like protein [Auxenochlorella protothecoides]KFM28553.1 Fanconi-associated nuclease 1-like protein [Auxenochlorella protothecoides]
MLRGTGSLQELLGQKCLFKEAARRGRTQSSIKSFAAARAVCLELEADNPRDKHATLVLDAGSGAALGHVPREVARLLGPLLAAQLVAVEGCVLEAPASSRASVPVEFQVQLLSDQEADVQAVAAAALRLQAATQPAASGDRLRANFDRVLEAVWREDARLLDREEGDFRETFSALTAAAAALFLRLFLRKGPWFRLQRLDYPEVPDAAAAVGELCAAGLAQTRASPAEAGDAGAFHDVAALAAVATARELQLACAGLEACAGPGARRTAIQPPSRRAALLRRLDAAVVAHGEAAAAGALLRQTGPLVRVAAAARAVVTRLQRLFFLSEDQGLSHFLAAHAGALQYPRYLVHRQQAVWSSRRQLLEYEAALQAAARLMDALEAGDEAAAEAELEGIWRSLDANRHKQLPSPLKQSFSKQSSLLFLSRFQAGKNERVTGWVHCLMATAGVSLLEKKREYVLAIERLQQLLGGVYCGTRRGDWWIRLSINLEHLGRVGEALEMAEAGLADDWLSHGDRLALQRRVLRLAKPPRRWKRPAWAGSVAPEPREVRIVQRPMASIVGFKSRFMGLSGEPCTVEQLALQHYARDEAGGWTGCHCEGGIWSTFFSLLLWEALFAPVPDVFRTPFQSSPLDLRTESFYIGRQDLIERILGEIAAGGVEERLRAVWDAHCGELCAGIRWDRWPLEELLTVAACVGGRGLAVVCRLLAEDHSGWAGGMPDLLLWNPARLKAKLVEVKGPRDRLSEQQRAWAHALTQGGLEVEVLKVVEPKASKK